MRRPLRLSIALALALFGSGAFASGTDPIQLYNAACASALATLALMRDEQLAKRALWIETVIRPALDEIAGAMGDKVKIVKLNVDENQDTAARYGVRGIPTMLLFKGGQPVAQKVGAAPRSQIQQWVEGNL